MLRYFSMISVLTLPMCHSDETLSGYGASDTVWSLVELDGHPFSAKAILIFPEPGRLSGEAPCNKFAGQQTAPYPWFKAEGVAATRRACPQLADETMFLDALNAMTLAEVGDKILILSTETGRQMVFISGG